MPSPLENLAAAEAALIAGSQTAATWSAVILIRKVHKQLERPPPSTTPAPE